MRSSTSHGSAGYERRDIAALFRLLEEMATHQPATAT
jgi:hypothetical protein